MFGRHSGDGWLQTGILFYIIMTAIFYLVFLRNKPKRTVIQYLGLLLSIWCIIEITQFPIATNGIAWEHIQVVHRFKYNIQPFDAIILAFREGYRLSILEILVNVLMFMPFGAMMAIVLKEKRYVFIKIMMSSMILSIVVELTQLITLYYSLNVRVFDINDIILNSLGGILGYVFIKVFHLIKKHRERGL